MRQTPDTQLLSRRAAAHLKHSNFVEGKEATHRLPLGPDLPRGSVGTPTLGTPIVVTAVLAKSRLWLENKRARYDRRPTGQSESKTEWSALDPIFSQSRRLPTLQRGSIPRIVSPSLPSSPCVLEADLSQSFFPMFRFTFSFVI